jgi:hypothetical protein
MRSIVSVVAAMGLAMLLASGALGTDSAARRSVNGRRHPFGRGGGPSASCPLPSTKLVEGVFPVAQRSNPPRFRRSHPQRTGLAWCSGGLYTLSGQIRHKSHSAKFALRGFSEGRTGLR